MTVLQAPDSCDETRPLPLIIGGAGDPPDGLAERAARALAPALRARAAGNAHPVMRRAAGVAQLGGPPTVRMLRRTVEAVERCLEPSGAGREDAADHGGAGPADRLPACPYHGDEWHRSP